MPRLIKIDPPELKIKHKSCGAIVAYYPNEIKSFIKSDYGDGSDTIYYIVCPHCKNDITVSNR